MRRDAEAGKKKNPPPPINKTTPFPHAMAVFFPARETASVTRFIWSGLPVRAKRF
jgi:hypothetical protein